MSRKFTNENFEKFLQQNADGLRMRPSDAVWKGITKHLNRKRRRMGFGLAIALLVTSTAGYYVVDVNSTGQPKNSQKNIPAIEKNAITSNASLPNTSDLNAEQKPSDNTDRLLASNFRPTNAASKLFLGSQQSISISNPEIISQTENTAADNKFVPTVTDDSYGVEETKKEEASIVEKKSPVLPMTIESVVNSYKSGKRKKMSMQIHFTPTVSYRKLTENQSYIKTVNPGNIPLNQQSLYDINNMVTHKPDFGFEIGVTAKYPISKNINLRGGLQFNINRYDIKVFQSSTQLATITLSDRNRTSSVSTATNYNNRGGGYKTNWLENFYFQVSAPIGVEAVLKGDEKVKFGIASTVQPTYMLGDRAYVISNDYKSYAEVPWLVRRWNVNTSFETFVAYSTGHLKWQVGPQVRYQLLSSFVKEYPVKENLFDFGLKVGIGLNNR